MGGLLYFLVIILAFIVGNWASETYIPCDWQFTVGAMFTIVLLFLVGLVNAYLDPTLLEHGKDDNKDDGEPKD